MNVDPLFEELGNTGDSRAAAARGIEVLGKHQLFMHACDISRFGFHVERGADGIDVGAGEVIVGSQIGTLVGREEGHLDGIGVLGGPAVEICLRGLAQA